MLGSLKKGSVASVTLVLKRNYDQVRNKKTQKANKINSTIIGLIIILNNYSAHAAFGVNIVDKATRFLGGAIENTFKHPVEDDISDNSLAAEQARLRTAVIMAGMATTVALTALGIGAALAFTDNGHNDYKILAAGDDASSSYATWMQVSMTNMKHKNEAKSAAPEYTSTAKSVSIGFDKQMDNGNLLGGLYQYSKGNLKIDSTREHDNTDHSFGINGNMYLMDHLHFMGVGVYTYSKVAGSDLLNNNKKTDLFEIDAQMLYDVKLRDDVLLIPRFGLNYFHSSRKSYKTINNTSFGSLSSSSLDGLVGATLEVILMNDHNKVVGEIFADIKHTLSNHSGRLNVSSPIGGVGTNITLPISLSTKTHYDVGVMLNMARVDSFSVSAGYTHSFSNKESAHTGTIGAGIEF